MTNKEYAVCEVQTWLRAFSNSGKPIDKINIDGIYGAETRNAVREYQSLYHLPETGVVNHITWCSMFCNYEILMKKTAPPTSIQPFSIALNMNKISKGEKFSLIYILQVMLETLSVLNQDLFDVDINGVYDAKTDRAVKMFQDRNGLPMIDYVDKETWDRLSAVYNQYLIDFNK